MTTLDILREARDLCARGWCQGDYAQGTAGEPIDPSESDARRWCVVGAIMRTAGEGDAGYWKARRALVRETPAGIGLPYWNDADNRTQADVVALYDAAIARLEATP